MRANARTNQGGSIVSFILVGAVLLAGLGAGVYYLSHRDGGAAERPQEVAQERTREGDSTSEPNGAAREPEENKDDKDSAILGQSDEEKQAAPRENGQGGEGAQSPAATPQQNQPQAAAPEQIATTGGSGSTQTLPQTGPADMLLAGGGLAALTFMVSVFVRSRRDLAKELS